MTEPTAPYDVAISFKWADQKLAEFLHRKLGESLNVFYIVKKQDEVAGRSGVEEMRTPFLTARLSVILYRETWGESGWTEVEKDGIFDGCLKADRGWKHMLCVAMDSNKPPPDWIPNHRMRFNADQFSSEELVGAIKSLVMELGGELQPLSLEKRIKHFQNDQKYEKARVEFRTSNAQYPRLYDEMKLLFEQIAEQCEKLKASGIRVGQRHTESVCVVRTENASIEVYLDSARHGVIEHEELVVREYKAQILLPNENRRYLIGEAPSPSNKVTYELELTRAYDVAWKVKSGDDYLSSTSLAQKVVVRLLDLSQQLVEQKNRQRLR